jgi:hypothetical protein
VAIDRAVDPADSAVETDNAQYGQDRRPQPDTPGAEGVPSRAESRAAATAANKDVAPASDQASVPQDGREDSSPAANAVSLIVSSGRPVDSTQPTPLGKFRPPLTVRIFRTLRKTRERCRIDTADRWITQARLPCSCSTESRLGSRPCKAGLGTAALSPLSERSRVIVPKRSGAVSVKQTTATMKCAFTKRGSRRRRYGTSRPGGPSR